MKKSLILLAGFPGTGKSYLANLIIEKFSSIKLLSPDSIKEKNWDLYGFNNLNEKEELIQRSWKEYYQEMEEEFRQGKSVLSDYPFSEKQRDKLDQLTRKFNYQVITIRLIADLDVLFARQKKRDLDDTRHLGHILTSYHKNDSIISRENADNLLDYKEFISRCTTRGYDKFSLGTLYKLDVTDFSKVNYNLLLLNLEKQLLGKEKT
ncbi:AAA family ATPase [Lactobacillus helsingborgensis]|uniref:AAA family ATPase n=1 Tax=Lactobacillus helsingborgensis TaxID=1218494 RepID=UPI0027412BB6|nr:AAA family ATPase [Lactobacillus helsingborgensis]WLT00192.1 AAA family ATPase [Lactobacillus helsingborgensis]